MNSSPNLTALSVFNKHVLKVVLKLGSFKSIHSLGAINVIRKFDGNTPKNCDISSVKESKGRGP